MKRYTIILVLSLGLYSCIGGGTHGSIKAYIYPVSKTQLENAIHKVILNNSFIIQDSIKGYYNNDTNYISIQILNKGGPYTYILKYGGGPSYWDTSKVSSVFIAYAHDEKGRGGSSGNGGVKWYNYKLKRTLVKPFEEELISKIDQKLGMTHSEE